MMNTNQQQIAAITRFYETGDKKQFRADLSGLFEEVEDYFVVFECVIEDHSFGLSLEETLVDTGYHDDADLLESGRLKWIAAEDAAMAANGEAYIGR